MTEDDYPDDEYGCDVNPVCGCHIRGRCGGCGHCMNCVGCFCNED